MQSGLFYAVVVGLDGEGVLGQYRLDVTISDELTIADLVASEIDLPSPPMAGDEITISWTVGNYGTAATDVDRWSDRVILSANKTIGDFDDIVLGNAVRTGALDPEQTYTAQVTTTLSERLAGDYHVFVQTDFRNDLFEFTLDDNNLSEAASLLTIAPPPLPDLVVASDSISAPASIDPTEAFDVSWVTSNEGAVGATGTWEERLYLSDSASGEKRQLLGTFVFEEDLAAGQSSTVRTNSIQLPPGSFAGDVYFVVEVDAADIVFESRENNRFVSSTSSSVPRLLSLDVSSSELTEGDSARRVTLTRNGATATPLTVRLAADDASQLGMPSEVIIPAWRSSTQFLVSANEDGIVDGNANVTLTASADGFTSADASLSVIDTDIPAITTTVSAEQLNEGDAATLNIRYNGLAGSDFVVRLSADSRSELQLPAVVTIPAGQNTLDIPFEVIDDEVFEGIESVTIESKAAGYVRGRARVAIAASDVPVLTLDLMPTTTEGSSDALGTVSIPVARQEPISISLATSQPSALFVLPTVTIPAGARSAQFSFIALENDQVDGERDVEITATPRPDFNSSPITPAAVSGSIRLLDNDGPTLTARLDRGLVSETGTAILTVSRNTDTALAMSVSLSSSDDTELSVPATLTIPAGLASAEVTVSGLEDDAVDGDQSVLVTAFAAGFNSGVASIVISDSNLPDLVPTSITAPAEVSPNARSTIQWSTSNQGIAPVTAGWTERIYLSADRLPGDDSLLAEYSFAGSLSVDVTNERSVPVLFPATPGEFWLVIEVDANERVREGLEANNFFVSPTPVFIQAPYTATVSADIDSASTGTPVTLTGSATNQDGSPAAFVDVAVTVTVRGTQRVLDARTDAAGNFEAIFTPLPGEGGRYTVAAAHPAISDSPSQDEFLLLGLQPIAGFDFIGLTVGSTTTETIRIRNLADVELSGLAVETVGVASGLSVTPTIASSDLGAFESFELSYDLTDSGAALGESQFILRITTNEAPSLEIPIAVNVMPVAAALFVDSETITTGMVVGEQTSIEFVIENRGGGDSGPIALLLPSGTPWLAVASGRTIENIVAGESAAVTLLLTPSLDLELTEYRGRMIASSDTSEVAINFNFRAVAETVGDLRVTVVDELFYFADDAPTVQGASVELRDPITRELIATSAGAANGAEGETAGSVSISDDGSVEFRGVPRGKYLVEVSSDEHDPSELLLTVPAGGLAEEQVFISRNFVEYTWNVEEIEVEDRTRVTIDATFETNVPAPVVVVESNIDLFGLDNPGDTRTFEIKYTNEGFIQAEDVQLFFESHPLYEIVPLVDVIPVLPARSSASIPVRITRRALPPGGAEGEFVPSIPGIDCYIYAYTTYRYVCGPFEIFKQVPIPVLNVGAGCAVGGFGGFGGGFSGGGSIGGGASGGGSGSTFGGGRRGFGSGGRPFVFGVSTPKVGSSPPDCQECEVERWELTLGGSGMLDTLLERAGRLVERSGVVKDVKISVEGSAGIETCCEDDVQSGYKLDAGGSASVSASFQFFIIGGKTKPVKLPPLNGYDVTVEIEAGVSISGSISGSLSGSVGNTCDAFLDFSGCASGGLTGSLTGAIGGGLSFTFSKGDDIFSVSAEGSLGIKASANAGLTLCIGEDDSEGWNVTLGKVVAFGELGAEVSQDLKDKLGITNDVGFSYRIEETIFEGVSWSSNDQEDTTGEGETNGSSAEQTLVFNGLADFFDIDSLGTSLGFESNDALAAALGEPGLDFAAIPPDEVQAFIQRVAEVATPDRNGQGVCAEVRLQIQQDVVQNRQAFSASLELLNGHFSSIESIRAGIQIEDRTGNNAEHLFAIETIELVGLGSLEGDSSLGQGDEATITWLIVPTQAAALTSPADYFVSGFFSYTDGGSQVEVPLAPAIITVTPQPALDLDYFLQRDVISDDPFTDEIEPAEIFTLGVQVQNRGVGTAKDLRIESAQPKIIENEKGLLIDFEIVGTSVNGEPAERTLTALIGDLPGGELAIAEWQLESTLQGLFTEYEASFEHISDFGSPELSLIKSVEIHELIRAVQATASGIDDSLTDFLVNDIPDPQDSPDSLYLSDGSVVDVQLGSNGQFDSPASFSNLVVNVTASMPTGWAYVNLTDPSDGEFQLVGVRRSDGTLLDPSNFWQTDRTFIGLGLRPLYENKVHLLDFDSTGKYEFIFSNGDLTGPGVERFTGVDPNPTARAIGHIDVRFDELIDPASLDISDVTLLKNGVAVPTAGITVLTGSNPLVRIGGLGTLTEEDAVYELQVDLAGVRDFVGNRGEGLESIIWVKGEAAPAVIALTGLPDEFSTSPISMFQLRVTEPVQLASLLGAVSLLHDGVSVDVGGASITEVENGLYEISGLESLTSTDGDYELTLDATALLDLDGNAGIGQRSHAWQLDATPPRITAVFAPPTNPRNIVVQRVDVEFSEAIDPSSLTVDDVMLIRDGGTENLLAGEGRVTVEDRGNNIYRIGGINWVQAFIADPQIADFTFSIDAAAVRDFAGNAGIGSESTTWTIDLVSPVAPENLAVAVEELPEGAGEESPNAVFSGTAFEPELTLVVENEFTGDELFRGRLTDTDFAIPLRLPAEGRNELSGRLIDIAGNTTDFDLPNAFVTSLPPIVTETAGFTPRIRRTTIDQFTLTFAKPVAADSFTADVLSLQRDGSHVGVPESVVIETSADRRMFTVSGLGDATFEEGEYRLSVDLRLLRGADGVRGTGTYTEAWTLDRTPPTTRVVSTLLESTTRRYFVSVESDAATPSLTEVSEFTVFAVSPNSPLARVARLDPETPGTEFEGDLDEEYVFFSDSLDAAGNRQPLTLASTGGFPITLDAAKQTDLPNDLIVAEGTTVQFSGEWSVELPEVVDGGFRHRIKISDRMLNVRTSTPWQNPVLAQDVNHSGIISPLDALIIINRLNSEGPGTLSAPTSMEGVTEFFYLDANGDHSVSPIDVLQIINLLNDRTGSGEGEPPVFQFDPRFLATEIHSPIDRGSAQGDSVDIAIQSLTTGPIPQRETPVQDKGIVSDVEEKDLVAAIDEFFGKFGNEDPLTLANI
jgi:hypothetical protein